MKKLFSSLVFSFLFFSATNAGCDLIVVPCVNGIGLEMYCVNADGSPAPCGLAGLDCGQFRKICNGIVE